jgi:hypothetical protein
MTIIRRVVRLVPLPLRSLLLVRVSTENRIVICWLGDIPDWNDFDLRMISVEA